MSRRILGLDIRHESVTAVLVETSMKGSWIEDAMVLAISNPTEIVKDLTSALENIIEKMNIEGAICTVSLPPDLIFFRNAQVPFGEKKKIEQILPFELEPMLPVPVDDLIIDFQLLKLSEKIDHTDIVSASIRKTELKCYTDTLSSLNIHPKIITIGGLSPAICISHSDPAPDQWLLVDLNKHYITVIGAISGQICIVRTFPFKPDSSDISSTQSIAMGIQQTLSGFEEITHMAFDPQIIYATGNNPENVNLHQDISGILEYPVQGLNLIQERGIGFKSDSEIQWEPAQMDNGLALALAEIDGIHSLNFRKGPFAEKNFWVEHKKKIIRSGILAVMVLISMTTYFLLDSINMQKKISYIDRQIDDAFKVTFPEVSNIKGSILQHRQLEAKLKELKEKNLISTASGTNALAIEVLNQISNGIPNEMDVQFTRLVLGDDNVQITGDTDALISVDNMKNQLEAVEIFKEITITSANREQSSNRVRFRLKVQL